MSYAAEVNNLTRDYYLLLTFPRTLPEETETTLEEVRRDLYQGRDAYNAESIIYGIAEYLFCLREELTEQDEARNTSNSTGKPIAPPKAANPTP